MIEALTAQIESAARARIETIDTLGGMLSAIEQRYPQGEIENSAFEAQQAVESGRVGVVGVNRYSDSEQALPPIHSIDPRVELDQQERIVRFRQSRDPVVVAQALAALKAAAQGNENLMPQVVTCVRAAATLGEISDVLREVFGEFHGV
jgi:methylmalonyl-CoA mutase N-terminal domain/subunit